LPFLHNELLLSPAFATIYFSGVTRTTLAVQPVPEDIFISPPYPPVSGCPLNYFNFFAPSGDRICSSTFLNVISKASTYFFAAYYSVPFKMFTRI